MPNTGLVNGEIVNGSGERYFSGNILQIRQEVESVYINQLLCNNVYNGSVYNSYGYNVNSVNCLYNDYFIKLRQKVGVIGSGTIADIIMDVIYRSSGGGLNDAIIAIEQSVIFLKAAYIIINIESIVEDV